MKLSDNNQPSSAPVGGEATVVQSVPTGDGIDIATMVKSDIEARALKGERTYGTRLKSGNGRDGLIDAYQEALDLALYLRQELEDRRRITRPDREAKARKVAEDIMDEYWFDDGLHVSSREKALSAITAALLQFYEKDL